MIAHVATRPAVNASAKGAELFRRQAVEQAKKRIKKANSAKKIGKKGAKDATKRAAKGTAKKVAKETSKETAKVAAKEGGKLAAKLATDASVAVAGTVAGAETGPAAPLIGIAAGMVAGEAVGIQMDIADAKANSRNRKIRFFLDKMKEEDKQQDSVAKLVRDLILNKMALPMKKLAVAAGAPISRNELGKTQASPPFLKSVYSYASQPFFLYLRGLQPYRIRKHLQK